MLSHCKWAGLHYSSSLYRTLHMQTALFECQKMFNLIVSLACGSSGNKSVADRINVHRIRVCVHFVALYAYKMHNTPMTTKIHFNCDICIYAQAHIAYRNMHALSVWRCHSMHKLNGKCSHPNGVLEIPTTKATTSFSDRSNDKNHKKNRGAKERKGGKWLETYSKLCVCCKLIIVSDKYACHVSHA